MKNCYIHYDISRGRIPKKETIYQHIDILHSYGLNGILFYMESVINTRAFPACGCGNTPLTVDYIQELSSYLRTKEMDFIPLFQVLGHQKNLLSCDPNMANYRERDKDCGTFRIDSPRTRKKIKQWLAELIPLFDSEYIHIGSDEVWDIGLGKSKSFVEKNGYEEAVADYLNDIAQFISTQGKKVILYADFLIHYPKLRNLLREDLIICNWGYGTKTEQYEKENHNFAMHEYITEGRRNWVTGNNMAEYIITPFNRLQENVSVWLELGGKSKADTFLISDWGSYENVNPFILSIIGDVYILKRLQDASFSLEQLAVEISNIIFGAEHNKFKELLIRLLSAQNNKDYFGSRVMNYGPHFPALLYDDPDSQQLIRICSCLEEDGLILFEQEAREIMEGFEKLKEPKDNKNGFLNDLKALSRRLLMIALRARLCFDHTWYTGAVWLTAKDIFPSEDRLKEYKTLAQKDIDWYMHKWEAENLETCQDNCKRYMEEAIFSTDKTIHKPQNSMLYFPPDSASS